jgi:hypothetical protein
MFGRLIRDPWFWIVFIAVFIAAMVVAGCGNPQQATPRPVCATYQAPDGTWMEEDNEPVDSDPCDLDDLFEKPKTTKPVPKASPAKPNVKNTRK